MHKSVKPQLYGRETSARNLLLRERKLCVLELLAMTCVVQLYVPEGGTQAKVERLWLSWPYGQASRNQTHVAGFYETRTATKSWCTRKKESETPFEDAG
jgi:hypothetical protein